jgi:type II secretory pathway pseudopilin PulG
MTGPAPESLEAGFTLLETIIAFVILALSLAVVTQTISTGGLTFRRASDLERASLVMTELSAGRIRNVDRAGEIAGRIGDSQWKITVREVTDRIPGMLFAVQVRVWPRGTDGPAFDYATFATPGRTQ